jgi:hypothetical protein
LCRAYYPNVRDAVLRAYPWRCATVRRNLAVSDDAPIGDDWVHQFQLPVDPYCLRVLKVDDGTIPYTVEGRFILCDESSLYLKFTERMADTGNFDALLSEAIECRLAAELAYPVTGSPTLINAMWKLYEAKIREARTIDGMEAPLEIWKSESLVWDR